MRGFAKITWIIVLSAIVVFQMAALGQSEKSSGTSAVKSPAATTVTAEPAASGIDKTADLQGYWTMDGDSESGREIRIFNDNGFYITFGGSFPMPYGYYEYDGKINSYDGSTVIGAHAYSEDDRRFTFSAKISGNKLVISNFEGEISNLNFNGTYTKEE